jgi:Zn-dependent peptidase ImmA (M78 family)/O-acetyl-ADP-ribose deacetylase (regulator of RNase III)
MKKPTKKSSVSMRTLQNDLKTLFRNEDHGIGGTNQDASSPEINLEDAVKLFDELRAGRMAKTRSTRETNWTHPSVLALKEPDPISAIISRARRLVLGAMERGWVGPPYNPFTLAEMSGMKMLPTENVMDARTRSDSEERYIIEFNPERPPARMRYSIAHEIGHTLFPDCSAVTRNRATHQDMKNDDWQLEALCNMAAAEILMPFGTLQENLSIRPSVGLIVTLCRKYLVSCEAVVNRLIRLSEYPCVAFFARADAIKSNYFVEYCIGSPALRDQIHIYRGDALPQSSKASACVAIGTRLQEDARWISRGKEWFVEYLGISPNTGEALPRVLALAFPPLADDFDVSEQLTFVPGDASEPFGAGPKLLLQVVNDQAQIWGGGFAKQIRKKWPKAQADFRQWASTRDNLKLGHIHPAKIRPDLTLISLVAQHGFGKPLSGPRLKYSALFSALEKVGDFAKPHSASVHMPRIGTGEAGGSWNLVEGIIRETLVSRGIKVTIYDLHARNQEFPTQPSFEFPRGIVDEVF